MPRRPVVFVAAKSPPEILLQALSNEVSPVLIDDWREVARAVELEPAPRRLFITPPLIEAMLVRMLEGLHERGVSPPLTVYLPQLTRTDVLRAWKLARLGATLLPHGEDLPQQVRELIRYDGSAVARYVIARAGLRCRECEEFLQTLGEGGTALTEPVEQLARRFNIGRTTLFRRLEQWGLPGPEKCQFLFRVIAAAEVLQAGGDVRRAIRRAHFSDRSVFRRAVRRRLGISVDELRRRQGWRWIVDLWLQRRGTLPEIVQELLTPPV